MRASGPGVAGGVDNAMSNRRIRVLTSTPAYLRPARQTLSRSLAEAPLRGRYSSLGVARVTQSIRGARRSGRAPLPALAW
jgi:hypothetical protein